MSKAGRKLLRSLRRLNAFFRGSSLYPMAIWTPDDEGDMVRHWADTPEEFYRLLDLDAKRKEEHGSKKEPTDIA